MLVCLAAAGLPAWGPVVAGVLPALADAGAWADAAPSGARWRAIVCTAWVCLLVSALSMLAAFPMAQVLRVSGVRVAALLVAPVWIPSWLIYAGLNLARAPDTVVGAAFLRWALDPAAALWGESNRWAIVLLGRGLALAALVLWSVPLAALVMAGVEDPEADAAAELARTDPMGPFRRAAMALRLRARAIGCAAGVIALLTMGSSVPLHLAQVETTAIGLWRDLAERPPSRWAGVWLAAWPQLVAAGLGAWWVGARLARRPAPGQSASGAPARAGAVSRVWTWAVWSAASLLPIALMVGSLDAASSLWRWAALQRDALWTTGWIAATGAAVAAAAGVATASAAASAHGATRRAARTLAAMAVFGALAPGVLAGAGIARLGLYDGVASVAAAAARVVFIGVVAGLVVAGAEPADERAARELDGAGGAAGWLRANARRAVRLGAGVWLGAFVLGLHEIEASVMVRPPGRGNLPQQMLSDLHYARLENLSAGGAVMGLFGLAVGVAAALALVPGTLHARERSGPGNPGGAGL